MVGGLGLLVTSQDTDRVHVPVKLSDIAFRDLPRGSAFRVGALDDLVVDIGEVLDERHAVSLEGQVAADDVEDDGAARVPDVAEVIHRDATDVHPDLARHEWAEFLVPARERVVDAETHGHGGDTFLPPEQAQSLRALRLHAHGVPVHAERVGQPLGHLFEMRLEPRALGQNGGVHVQEAPAAPPHQVHDPLEQHQT